MLLRDKIILVSGIGPGMGSKLVIEAAREGAAGVIGIARTRSRLDDAESMLRAEGLDTPMVKAVADIRDRAQCDAAARDAIARFGRIDALINSAFIHGGAQMPSETRMEEVRDAIETNLIGTLNITQAVIPQMKAQKSGAIVMVSTQAARKVVRTTDMIYAMSKQPLESAVRHLAWELGAFNIRVNLSLQGYMWGDVVSSYVDRVGTATGRTRQAVIDDIASRNPLGRIVSDDECARAVLFLVSDYATAVTGAQLDINAGEWMP